VASTASSSSSGGGLGGFFRKALSTVGNVTGVTDAINCIKNPSVGTCVKAAIKLTATAATIVTLGGGAEAEVAADGATDLIADSTADTSADVSAEAGGDDTTAAEEGGWKPSGRPEPGESEPAGKMGVRQRVGLCLAAIATACGMFGAVDGGASETGVIAASVSPAAEVQDLDPDFLEKVTEMGEGSENVVPEDGDEVSWWLGAEFQP
jgi:hypothetical protein